VEVEVEVEVATWMTRIKNGTSRRLWKTSSSSVITFFLFLSLFSPFFKTILFFNVCYLLHYNYTLCIYEKVVWWWIVGWVRGYRGIVGLRLGISSRQGDEMRLKSLLMWKSAMICFEVAFGCLNYCLVIFHNAITVHQLIKLDFKVSRIYLQWQPFFREYSVKLMEKEVGNVELYGVIGYPITPL